MGRVWALMPDDEDAWHRQEDNSAALPDWMETGMPGPQRVCGVGSIEVNSDRGDRLDDTKEGQGHLSHETMIQVSLHLFR